MQGNLISLETPCHGNFLRSFLQIGPLKPEVIQASRHVACCEPLNVSPILLSQTVVFKAQIIGPQQTHKIQKTCLTNLPQGNLV